MTKAIEPAAGAREPIGWRWLACFWLLLAASAALVLPLVFVAPPAIAVAVWWSWGRPRRAWVWAAAPHVALLIAYAILTDEACEAFVGVAVAGFLPMIAVSLALFAAAAGVRWRGGGPLRAVPA
jgi:hypothetical protein